MIDDRSLQRALANMGHYVGKIDGIVGPLTARAIHDALTAAGTNPMSWPDKRKRIAAEQLVMKYAGIETGNVDGFAGPQTAFAWEKWQDYIRDIEPIEADVHHLPNTWPRQRNVRAYFGDPGANQKQLGLPFRMKLAWNTRHALESFSIHEKAHASASRAFERILEIYGPRRIAELGLDLFGGSFNIRKMRGGASLSMHAWGIAIDFDPAHNQHRWGGDHARLAGTDYQAFFDIWEEEGWISLGRARNYDWMHVQAARL